MIAGQNAKAKSKIDCPGCQAQIEIEYPVPNKLQNVPFEFECPWCEGGFRINAMIPFGGRGYEVRMQIMAIKMSPKLRKIIEARKKASQGPQ